MAVNPAEHLEDLDDLKEEVLKSPDNFNFRGKKQDNIYVFPDHVSFREGIADLNNKNLTLRTNMQSSNEKYVTVTSNEKYSLIESHAEISRDGVTKMSIVYYLEPGNKQEISALEKDDAFIYDGVSWDTVYNPIIGDIAQIAPELYSQAEDNMAEMKEETGYEENFEGVPPPRDHVFTD